MPETAARLPRKIALIFGDRDLHVSRAGAADQSDGQRPQALGVKKGDRVTLFAQNSAEWVLSYIGIAKAGAVINPVNAMLTADELAYVVKDCGAQGSDHDVGARQDCRTSQEGRQPEGDRGARAARRSRTRFRSQDLLAGAPDTVEAPGNAPEDLSTICYTSGTTGFPKGAMLSHHSVVLNAAMTAAMNMRTEHDVQFTGLPLAHVYGTVVMNLSFLLGLTFVMLEKFDTQQALESIQRHKVTIMDGVPTMYLYMLSYPDFGKYDLSSLRTAVVGGQAMPAAKATEWLERVGTPDPRAVGHDRTGRPRHHAAFLLDNRLGSAGIADAVPARAASPTRRTRRRRCRRGEVGELMVRGPYTMLGYYGNEKATEEAIEPDGWLHSGDLCKMDADGYFYIVDRKKDMILTAGYNIYPGRDRARHRRTPGGRNGRRRPDSRIRTRARSPRPISCSRPARARMQTDHRTLPETSRGLQGAARGAIRPSLPTTSSGKIMRRELKTLDQDVATAKQEAECRGLNRSASPFASVGVCGSKIRRTPGFPSARGRGSAHGCRACPRRC